MSERGGAGGGIRHTRASTRTLRNVSQDLQNISCAERYSIVLDDTYLGWWVSKYLLNIVNIIRISPSIFLSYITDTV